MHCVKFTILHSFFDLFFLTYGQNAEIYNVNLWIPYVNRKYASKKVQKFAYFML